jgi:hypothetical protein
MVGVRSYYGIIVSCVFVYKVLITIYLSGGESVIRTLLVLLESVSYRKKYAADTVYASHAVAHCPPLPAELVSSRSILPCNESLVSLRDRSQQPSNNAGIVALQNAWDDTDRSVV